MRLSVEGRYGVKIPIDGYEASEQIGQEPRSSSLWRKYRPCDICGESRITHECHLVPRVEGGPHHADNLVWLCPLHHHLFDHHRLTKQEWETLMEVIRRKMPGAATYADEVHAKELQRWWDGTEGAPIIHEYPWVEPPNWSRR
jgi:hypothetical protein